MSTSNPKTLSPAELAKLEHSFAADPSSDAYKPLAEAYLAMGRFMEAMVVCKKGVKAHPELAAPRVLLARVYAEQGKDKKALEESLGALQSFPTDKHALRLTGLLQLRTGEADAGKANLLKAHEADPSDVETLALLKQHQLEPKGATPAPAPEAPAAAPAPVAAAPVASAPVAAAPAPVAAPAQPAPVAARPAASEDEAPARPAARRPAVEQDEDYEDEDVSPRRKPKTGTGMYITLGLLAAVVLVGGGYGTYSSRARARNREVGKHLKVVAEQLKKDTYAAYQEATKAGDAALEVDSDFAVAHAFQAYTQAIRWGEYAGGDEARAKAETHLAAAQNGVENNANAKAYVLATEALLKLYGNKGKEALAPLEARIKELEAEDKPNLLLYQTLGQVQMGLGDLELARDNLERAQTAAEPRVYASLGTVYQRLGEGAKADTAFDAALRYEKQHHESMLGKALGMLGSGNPDYEKVTTLVDQVLKAEPPPSPRQLAIAHLTRSLLLARVAASSDFFKDKEDLKKKLEAAGVPTEKDKAREQLLKAEQAGFTLDKKNPELFVIKGRRLLLEGQVDAAADEFKNALKMDGTRIHFHMELARALLRKQGGEQAAVDALTAALKSHGDSPALLVMLGHAYRKQGKLDEALAQYQRAAKNPKAKVPEAHVGLGSIHRERSEWDKAQAAFERSLRDYVGQMDRAGGALTEMGRMFQAKGDLDKAEEAFVRALKYNEAYGPAYYLYASFLAKERKQTDKAKVLAQAYLSLEPKGEYATEAQRLAQ